MAIRPGAAAAAEPAARGDWTDAIGDDADDVACVAGGGAGGALGCTGVLLWGELGADGRRGGGKPALLDLLADRAARHCEICLCSSSLKLRLPMDMRVRVSGLVGLSLSQRSIAFLS